MFEPGSNTVLSNLNVHLTVTGPPTQAFGDDEYLISDLSVPFTSYIYELR